MAEKSHAYIGVIEVVGGEQSDFQQRTSKTTYVDKESGSYARSTFKEAVSTGETFKERGSGRAGFKDECKVTATYKVGDKSGYTEYQTEEKYRRVNFDDNSSYKGNSSYGNKKYFN